MLKIEKKNLETLKDKMCDICLKVLWRMNTNE